MRHGMAPGERAPAAARTCKNPRDLPESRSNPLHRRVELGGLDPGRGILVAGDVEHQESIGAFVIGGERRVVPGEDILDRTLGLLVERRAEKIHDQIAGRIGQVGRGDETKLVERDVAPVGDPRLRGVGLDELAKLLQREATACDAERSRFLVEEVVLREASIRRPLRNLRGGDGQGIEHHDSARRAAEALALLRDEGLAQVKIVSPRLRLDEQPFPFGRVERDESRRKLGSLGAGPRSSERPQGQGEDAEHCWAEHGFRSVSTRLAPGGRVTLVGR